MAPRLLLRALAPLVRGGWLTACLGLAGAAAGEEIVGAAFRGETDVYAHCILGDCIEYSVLEIISEDSSGQRYARSFELWPAPYVFEDIEPRLWDITGDGAPEVVVILSSLTLGASLAVYDLNGRLAQTEHIGRTNRWLAPVAAADFDGDGRIEVAFVDRPHLAKVLRIFEWDGDGLVLDAELGDLTNHRIGEDFISGGLRECGAGPEMVTADGDWSDVMITRFRDGNWGSVSAGRFSPARLAQVLACG